MDVRELRYFAAVFAERNLTAAAQRCFISQPSISAAIASLEAELGTALFIRHKKGVAPTAAAEQLYSVARRVIDEVDAARNLFRTKAPRPSLTIGLMRTLDLPRTIALLKPLTGHADVALRLVGVNDAADARIISKSLLDTDELFLPLWVDRYVAALPPSHPLTLKDRLRTSDFAGVAMIDRCHCEQSAFFKGTQPRQTVAIAESEDWAMALVAAGVGIAIVPEGVARGHPDVALRQIEADVKRQVGLAYSAARPPSGALQKLISGIREQRPVSGRASRAAAPTRPRNRRT